MDGLSYTTVIEFAKPLARRRGSALDRWHRMKSSLRWIYVAVGAALWLIGSFAVDHLHDDAMRLAEADLAAGGNYQSGDLLKAYDVHLSDTRGERFFFYVLEFGGFALAVFSGQLAKKKGDAS
jgi:hypothetical protein